MAAHPMTSPITAEDRAKAAYREWVKHPAKGGLAEEIMALLASAIREAEDAALERVAVMIEEGPLDTERFMRGIVVAAGFEEIAERIRSLKSTKETGHE